MQKVETELFALSDQSLYILENIPFYHYKIDNISDFTEYGLNKYLLYRLLSKEIGKNVNHLITNQTNTYGITSFKELKKLTYDIKIINRNKKAQLKLHSVFYINESNSEKERIIKSLINMDLKKYMLQEYDIKNKGYTYYIEKNDLLGGLKKSNNAMLNKIQQFIKIYPGFSIYITLLNNTPYLHIQPKCHILFSEDVDYLITNDIINVNELSSQLNVVSNPSFNSANFIGLTKFLAKDPLGESPFEGDSYINYYNKYYDYEYKNKESKLALINLNSRYNIRYSSLEKMYPVMNFSNLLNMDREFTNKITSSMKTYSSKRGNVINYIQEQYPIKLFGFNIDLEQRLGPKDVVYNYDFTKKNILNSDCAIIFDTPNVYFKNKLGDIIETTKYDKYVGYPGDIFNPEVFPYDTPRDINLEVIVESNLEKDTNDLLNNLSNGFGKYPSFETLFNTKLNINSIIPTDNLVSQEIYDKLDVLNTDIALIVGSKSPDQKVQQQKYTYSKNECLKRGIPAQYLENASTVNKIYDRSIKFKSTHSDTLFGLGLNLQSKIGSKILELSENTTRHFLSDSLIFSYNIARIFEPINYGSTQSGSPRDKVKKTTPFTTPIVITNNKGTEIMMQYVYEISRETELFSGERGKRILDELPSEYENIIIHKDGPFFKEEINDLKKLQREDKRIMPVSIITNNVSRMFLKQNKIYDIVKRGLVIQLDNSSYLMSTTLFTNNMKPEERGWPNPIKVKIYERALNQKLTSEEKTNILYQIWALTRTYLNSQIPTRRPLSIHYSNRMGEFLTKLGNRNPQFISLFRNKRNRHNYVPRIFL